MTKEALKTISEFVELVTHSLHPHKIGPKVLELIFEAYPEDAPKIFEDLGIDTVDFGTDYHGIDECGLMKNQTELATKLLLSKIIEDKDVIVETPEHAEMRKFLNDHIRMFAKEIASKLEE